MATINGYTKERMDAMEAATIIDGDIVGDNLILTKHDGSTVNAGNVRGLTGTPGVTVVDYNTGINAINANMALNAPIGSIIDTIESVVPNALWLTMVGQTITNGQTLYPIFWAKIPASMKAGANIVMPNTAGKVSVGLDINDADFNAINKIGGAKNHTLDQNQIPLHVHYGDTHSHTIDPPNTGVSVYDGSHSHGQAAHNHSIAPHGHTQDSHWHGANAEGGFSFIIQGSSGNSGVQATPGPFILSSTGQTTAAQPGISNSNTLYTDSPAPTIYGAYSNITAAVEISPFTSSNNSGANTGATGGNAAHNNLQPFVTFLKIIKVA